MHEELTPKEVEVLHLVSEGYQNSEIANRLHISIHTTKTHLRHLFQKVGVSNRVRLAVFAHTGRRLQDA